MICLAISFIWLDLSKRLLPNKLVLALAVLFIPYFLLSPLGFNSLLWHLLTALIAFVVFFILYMLNAMGGGDVKLATVVYLWAGSSLALPVTVVIAWSGGIVAVFCWLADTKLIANSSNLIIKKIHYYLSAKRGVPYGVALSFGLVYIIWQNYLGA